MRLGSAVASRSWLAANFVSSRGERDLPFGVGTAARNRDRLRWKELGGSDGALGACRPFAPSPKGSAQRQEVGKGAQGQLPAWAWAWPCRCAWCARRCQALAEGVLVPKTLESAPLWPSCLLRLLFPLGVHGREARCPPWSCARLFGCCDGYCHPVPGSGVSGRRWAQWWGWMACSWGVGVERAGVSIAGGRWRDPTRLGGLCA